MSIKILQLCLVLVQLLRSLSNFHSAAQVLKLRLPFAPIKKTKMTETKLFDRKCQYDF